MLLVRTLSYSQEDHRFFSARRGYNRIRKNSANVDGYRRDQAEVCRKDVDSRTCGPKGRYRGIQSGKSRADRHGCARGGFREWPERIYGSFKS